MTNIDSIPNPDPDPEEAFGTKQLFAKCTKFVGRMKPERRIIYWASLHSMRPRVIKALCGDMNSDGVDLVIREVWAILHSELKQQGIENQDFSDVAQLTPVQISGHYGATINRLKDLLSRDGLNLSFE